ncbi:hypothetical protein [Bacillus paralicheniformis]|uniref:hypothetical protein n=1 Tax=Bacillus paralicheniformis TaxID=1648923 RepID=UPI003BF94174
MARYREEALFGIFDGPLTEEERFCLQFLYAYIPLHDMADYDGAYFLKHVRRTLETRGIRNPPNAAEGGGRKGHGGHRSAEAGRGLPGSANERPAENVVPAEAG